MDSLNLNARAVVLIASCIYFIEKPNENPMVQIIQNPTPSDLEVALSRPQFPELEERVLSILQEVKTRGDQSLFEFALRFDQTKLKNLQVTPDEFLKAESLVPSETKESIQFAIRNIQAFHQAQKPTKEVRVETTPGVICWKRWLPLECVGIYVPSGSAPLFSSLYMAAIPARIAGVSRLAVCVPPLPDGFIHPTILYVAQLFEINEVYKVGGAGAIAALSYGTESISRVDKIVGPGSPYTALAKQSAYPPQSGWLAGLCSLKGGN